MTNEAVDLAFIRRVLRVFDDADIHSELYWHVEDDAIRLLAMCSDVFWWATADCEPITPDNVGVLEQALVDLRAAGDHDYYATDLFAARTRGMRPMRRFLDALNADCQALFEACGPERTALDEG